MTNRHERRKAAKTMRMDRTESRPAHTMSPAMREVVETFVRDNPEANRAYNAMIGRGLPEDWAEAEVARVLTACLWEASHGHTTDPKRLDTALQALAKGHSAEELFPDELYEGGGNSPAD